ncbi:hypothetical protein KR059_003916 [Drosophila kikkawai]|nr:hypothetical protein KR059_003916 [Drosophila kikkawai]
MFQDRSTCIIFLGALHGLIILHTAKAEIPGCHFLETVNITSGQRLENGSFMYQGIEVPEYLTGQYDYIRTENGYKEFTNSHLRGCICHLKPCIWICCRFKDWDASNGKCNDGLMEKLSEINPFLQMTLISGSVVKQNLLKDLIVLRDRMRLDDSWEKDEYSLFEVRPFCSITSGHHIHILFIINFISAVMWLSIVFLVLTIAVYLYVRMLRNLHGKCSICYMMTTLMYFIHQLLMTDQMFLQLCALQGYLMYFFLIAKFSWLLALSHQLWRGFTSVNRAVSEYSFGAYSTFAWGTPAILTGVLFMLNHIWDGDPNAVERVPGIGWQLCYLKSARSFQVYNNLPMFILISLNTTLFILTTISIIRVKLSLKHFSDLDERAKHLNTRMQTHKVFLRLVALMDLQWSLRLIYLIDSWKFILKICRYFDSCIGILIFVLFVLKRSTLKLLWER